MFDLWRARGGRRAANAALVPLVAGTRQRIGEIPDTAWNDPYVIGFLGMLITLLAERNAGALSADALASVQSSSWRAITGSSGELLGEEISFLSTARDASFVLGCQNAETFFRAMMVAHRGRGPLGDAGTQTVPSEAASPALWAQYFDAYLFERMPLAGPP